MRLAEGIRRHGFRSWYQRELLQSHAHLTLVIFAALGLLGALEAMRQATGLGPRLQLAAGALASAGIGLWALRRYLGLLARAEHAANQADCTQCGAYGRLELLQSDASGDEVGVRCKGCGHRWHISG